jgi:hypothetical protein
MFPGVDSHIAEICISSVYFVARPRLLYVVITHVASNTRAPSFQVYAKTPADADVPFVMGGVDTLSIHRLRVVSSLRSSIELTR